MEQSPEKSESKASESRRSSGERPPQDELEKEIDIGTKEAEAGQGWSNISASRSHESRSDLKTATLTDETDRRDVEEATTSTDIENQSSSQVDEEAYSIFTVTQKRLIVLVASFCAFFSPVTASIYYPSLDTIAHDLNITNTAVNLTVTTYLILQGIAPTFVGAFSDSAGRRPAFVYCFVVYIIANIGLALQNSYVALIVLRCIQSAGSSGTVALSNGIAADVVTTSERGSYVAFASLGSLLGPTIGPVIGGIIAEFLGWHWIFWFLAILAGAFFVPLMLFFPETNRKVVWDGSYPPPWHCQSLTGLILTRNLKKRGHKLDPKKQAELKRDYKVKFPNPVAVLRIAWEKGSFVILLANGLVFAVLYAILTGISELFTGIYDFNQIQVALCYLPFGAGSIISSMIVGRFIDWNYDRHAKKLGYTIIKNRKQHFPDIPLEKARVEIAFPLVWSGVVVTIIYGWILHFQTNLAGPLVVLFLAGASMTGIYQSFNIMLIDSHPDAAATATAANNLFRCLIGAGATAVLGPMLNAWGPGWTYTFAALLWVLYMPALMLLVKKGPEWRAARLAKEEARRAGQQHVK